MSTIEAIILAASIIMFVMFATNTILIVVLFAKNNELENTNRQLRLDMMLHSRDIAILKAKIERMTVEAEDAPEPEKGIFESIIDAINESLNTLFGSMHDKR